MCSGAHLRTYDVGKKPPSLLRYCLWEKAPIRTVKTRTASDDTLQLKCLSPFTNQVESEQYFSLSKPGLPFWVLGGWSRLASKTPDYKQQGVGCWVTGNTEQCFSLGILHQTQVLLKHGLDIWCTPGFTVMYLHTLTKHLLVPGSAPTPCSVCGEPNRHSPCSFLNTLVNNHVQDRACPQSPSKQADADKGSGENDRVQYHSTSLRKGQGAIK